MTRQNAVRVMISTTHDPFFNLATENWIFRDLDPRQKVLFLWRNEDTVVIGRFQNPWVECHTQKMQEDKVHLARRQSGGGAVFHDLGNTNFTFLSSKQDFDKSVNNQIIIESLKSFGIVAQASGRNDITVQNDDPLGPKKISGSAFKETKDRAFHHGTLLINANLSRLGNYLNPDKKKLEGKGITSVKARVANLKDLCPSITHEDLSARIIQQFFTVHGAESPIEYLDVDYLKKQNSLNRYYEELKDWNWRFGETPNFTHHLEERFAWGGMDVHIDCSKGIVRDLKIYSDTLHPELVEGLTLFLRNSVYSPEGIQLAVSKASQEFPMVADYLSEFGKWLASRVH
ncbi:MAG: lipoate--protein ligase [Bdellovibrionales bacterium GWA2_49_15]|nr:MAG: lipoate--protein ligase [Bdellovibrionales bacterium GWA2_49_15]HAZ13140.1 lipoate--protein ligase [Bdellovibrionales bacterium]